jgi:hypothetical protein
MNWHQLGCPNRLDLFVSGDGMQSGNVKDLIANDARAFPLD